MFSKGVFYLLGNQKGQALLIIVLVMVVALTVGLSVASRTITNLRNTRDQANSQKALSAAEAGIEQAIKKVSSCVGTCANGSFTGNTTYSTTITQVDGTTPFLLNGEKAVDKNDAIYVWLSAYSTNFLTPWAPSGGTLTIYWGDGLGACNNAAIEVSIISGSKAAPIMTRKVFDPCPDRASNNHFDNLSVLANATKISNVTPAYKATIPITNGLLARVDPIYFGATIGASGSIALPLQGNIITSTGISDSTTQRKVTVYQGYPEVPAEFFPYILFSP